MDKSTEPTPSEQQRGKQDGKPAEPSEVMSRADALDLLIDRTPYGSDDVQSTSCAVTAIVDAYAMGFRAALSHPPSEGSAAS